MDKNENKKEVKKELKNYVYSIRLTKKQKDVLKRNDWIKKELDRQVIEYIGYYL